MRTKGDETFGLVVLQCMIIPSQPLGFRGSFLRMSDVQRPQFDPVCHTEFLQVPSEIYCRGTAKSMDGVTPQTEALRNSQSSCYPAELLQVDHQGCDLVKSQRRERVGR